MTRVAGLAIFCARILVTSFKIKLQFSFRVLKTRRSESVKTKNAGSD